MSYKILHIPSATFVYECYGASIKHGDIPVLLQELLEPDNSTYYRLLVLRTKKDAMKAISLLIKAIRYYRADYKRHPERYSCCLNTKYYSIIKISD